VSLAGGLEVLRDLALQNATDDFAIVIFRNGSAGKM
jgi:hypothetical protein